MNHEEFDCENHFKLYHGQRAAIDFMLQSIRDRVTVQIKDDAEALNEFETELEEYRQASETI